MPTKTPLSDRLRTHARIMRRTATPPEHRLWQALRNNQLNGYKFRRQTPIGPYIVDFYCPAARLIVEVDGITHTDPASDAVRTTWLKSQGHRVLRVWNNEIMTNLDGVLLTITTTMQRTDPAAE